MNLTPLARPGRPMLRLAWLVLCSAAGAVLAHAADLAPKSFDLPGGDAGETLKRFAQQAGREIVFPSQPVSGVQTHAVQGAFTPRAALDQMLAGTELRALEDEKTGALTVLRRPVAPARPASTATTAAPPTVTEALPLQMAEVTVLGSRIRQTETAGPSPVNSYDQDYINATGSMTLPDFLNRIPQAYSGIASGRGSAPDEFNPEFGQRTETTSPAFNFVLGAADAPPAQTGVSGVSLRGLGAGSTLVLVDGRRVAQSGNGNKGTDTRQGFVDLNTISLGMIERIEVTTDGASAIYGADAVAGVINIVLKKNYNGTEVSGGYKATQHGGGRERNVSVTSGFTHGKLNGTVSLDYYDRQNLAASDRSFSRHQDHSAIDTATITATGLPRKGVNYTLSWGYPAVIQAAGGVVSGTFDAIPGARVVMVPAGAANTPAPAQFTVATTAAPPASIINASGQRRANTASYLDLIPKSERRGASGSLRYRFNERIDAYVTYRTSDTRSLFRSQPTTSITGSFGAAVTVPAAFNPFNQNVTVGMILPEWGSTNQRVRTLADAITGGLRGRVASWEWDLGYSWEKQSVRQTTRNFNGAGFAPLLINPDPALRFNPFIDFAAPGARSQAALLETLSVYPELYSVSKGRGLDLTADGSLFTYRERTVKLAFGGSTSDSDVWSRTTSFSSAVVPLGTATVTSGGQRSNALFTELYVPVFGRKTGAPLMQRLDFQLAGRWEENGPFTKSVPKYGVSWSPVQSILIRGSWSQGFRAPGVTEYLVTSPNITSTLVDPRRTPASTPGIIVTRGSNPDPKPEASDNTFAGLVYEPAFAKGLNLQFNYYSTKQTDVLQVISAQNIINNEALFASRVTRAAPTAADAALGQPGQITAVSSTFINFGRVINRSMDFTVDYSLPWDRFGRFRANVAASRSLEATRQVAPGQPPVVLDEDTGSPPKWKLNAALFWTKGPWNASAFVWYLDGFKTNNAGSINVANSAAVIYYPTPAVTKLDLRAGYEFKRGLWRGYGRNLRVNLGVTNVFDKKPPFSDTLWGFNAGLHSQLILGRGFELSFRQAL
jgi:iron complex outermembrane recepter protein